MEFYKDWNFWLAIFTAGTALFAIFQTQRQIKLSNKQQLFDSRMEAWEKINGLLQLMGDRSNQFSSEKDIPLELTIPFIDLTNNAYLSECLKIIGHELENPMHSNFLLKMEELRVLAQKIRFLFSGNAATLCSNFVFEYQVLLREMYKYNILMRDVDKNAQQYKLEHPDPRKYFAQRLGEPQRRKELEEEYDKLKGIYELIKQEEVVSKIEKQISLRKF